jgi:hypothetical protein
MCQCQLARSVTKLARNTTSQFKEMGSFLSASLTANATPLQAEEHQRCSAQHRKCGRLGRRVNYAYDLAAVIDSEGFSIGGPGVINGSEDTPSVHEAMTPGAVAENPYDLAAGIDSVSVSTGGTGVTNRGEDAPPCPRSHSHRRCCRRKPLRPGRCH